MSKEYQTSKGFCVLDDTPCKQCGKCAGMGMRVTKDSLLKIADKASREVQNAVFALNNALVLIDKISNLAPRSLMANIWPDRINFANIYISKIAAQLHSAIGSMTATIEKTSSEEYDINE